MNKWYNILGTIIIFALLIYVLRDINFYEVYILLAEAKFFWLILAIIATGFTFLISTISLKYIFKKDKKFGFFYLMKVIFAGAFFNTVTPAAGIGGEPLKAHYLGIKYKKPKSEMLGGVLADTFFRTVVFFIFVILSIFFVFMFIKISENLRIILQLILLLIFLSSFIVLFILFKKSHSDFNFFVRKIYWFNFIKKRFKTEKTFVKYAHSRASVFYHSFKNFVTKKRIFFVEIFYGVLFWFFNFLTAYFLFNSFNYSFNFLWIIVVFTLAQLIGNISPVPGGIGVVEGARMFLYVAMGVPPSLALLVSFLQRSIYYFYSLFIGGIILVHLKMSEV